MGTKLFRKQEIVKAKNAFWKIDDTTIVFLFLMILAVFMIITAIADK